MSFNELGCNRAGLKEAQVMSGHESVALLFNVTIMCHVACVL